MRRPRFAAPRFRGRHPAGELAARAERRHLEAQQGRQEIEHLYRQLEAAFERASEAEAARRSEQLKAALLDARRDSIIVDYNYNDEIEGYRKSPDSLAGRGGLRIRDEIRMIRPGFYLGRAYANRAFLLNFTLYNPDAAERDGPAFANAAAIAEDCWPGEQARKSAAR